MRRSSVVATVSVTLAIIAGLQSASAMPLLTGAAGLDAAGGLIIDVRGGGGGHGGGGHGGMGNHGGYNDGGSHYQHHYSYNYPHYYRRNYFYYTNPGGCYWWAGVRYCNY